MLGKVSLSCYSLNAFSNYIFNSYVFYANNIRDKFRCGFYLSVWEYAKNFNDPIIWLTMQCAGAETSEQLKYLDERDRAYIRKSPRSVHSRTDNKVRVGMPLDRISATFMLSYADHRGGHAECLMMLDVS